jgi:gas vesicle structural protein
MRNSIMTTPNNIVFTATDAGDETSLLDILDHVLNQGAIIRGNIIISLAGVDLVYLGLDVILTSVETALKHMRIELPAARRPS